MILAVKSLYMGVFRGIEHLTSSWLPGLAARLIFSSVLMFYFLHAASLKVGSGFPGILIPKSGAYAQMLPPIAEQYGYNADKIPFFPYGLIVYAGTYAEFILPLLILVGLFTRLSSLAFLVFIAVLTFVDINFHNVDAKTIGHVFDRVSTSVISDQRLLWCFPLLYLLIKGPGVISLDGFLGRFYREEDI